MFKTAQFNDFLKTLPKKRVTIDLQTLWLTFGRCFPAEVGSGQSREILSSLIEVMVENGYRLPSSNKKNYDRSAFPQLPFWIKQPEQEKQLKFNPKNHLWAPELAFLASRTRLVNHELWLRVNFWLKDNRNRDIPFIPLRERSYQIFRDEKALDALRKTSPFLKKEITLEELRCFVVYEPLPTELGPPSAVGKSALIVENQTTHWSIAHWNRSSGRYACVVYGGGNKISAAWEWLVLKQQEFKYSEIKYFGDIDVTGFEIPQRVKKQITEISEIPFSLDVDLYSLLIQEEQGKIHLPSQGKTDVSSDLLEGLPSQLAGQLRKVLLVGNRIPQEAITQQILSQQFNRL